MTTKYALLVFLFSINIIGFSQNTDNSIEDQFTKVIDKSNSYKEFKVIKKAKLKVLRKNILDSIALLENTIDTTQEAIEKLQSQINALTQNLGTTKKNLSESIEKENGLDFLGIRTNKTTYNIVLWSIVFGLISLLALIFVKHKRNQTITKETILKLDEVETEFEAHRKKTLTNEQLLRRKLQDEINKNRKV
jgi:tetrahydromethanopterin S-methyltransferase subunit B